MRESVEVKVKEAKPVSAEEVRLRKAVLAQYDENNESDGEDETDNADDGSAPRTKQLSKKAEKKKRKETSAQDMAMMFVNDNRSVVQDAARAERDMHKYAAPSYHTPPTYTHTHAHCLPVSLPSLFSPLSSSLCLFFVH